jgi:hypothetical protein
MKKQLGLLVATLALVTGCAPWASNISPSPISSARYEGWNCNKLRAEQKFVEDSLVRVSADQDSAATTDIWMVILIGVPTSGGGVKGEVARLKGEQIALHHAMLMAGCITGEEKKQTEVKIAPPVSQEAPEPPEPRRNRWDSPPGNYQR